MQIRNRVRELRAGPASELLPNRKNWRRHPVEQAAALRGLLAEIGYADVLIARDTPDGLVLLDGHLRASSTPNMMVPVAIVDLTEAEGDRFLLTADPLAGMAVADAKQVQALLATVQFESESIGALLEKIAGEAALAAINSGCSARCTGASDRQSCGVATQMGNPIRSALENGLSPLDSRRQH